MNLRDYENDVIVYASEITHYLQGRGVRLQDAQDSVQDVVVKMLELDIMIPPDKLRAWMYRTALYVYIDKYRRSVKYQEILSKLTKESVNFAQEILDIKPYLSKLTGKEQQLIEHYYYQNYTVKQLSSLTGHSYSKVKSDLYRTRKKLKKLLEKDDYSEWII